MKKALKWFVIVVCLLVVVLLAVVMMFGGAVLKGSVNALGSKKAGVPVSLEDASFRPFSGKIKLTNLHIGNPEGFKTPSLFDLGEVEIDLDVTSLLTDTIVIHRIVVVSPHITYERALMDSNFGVLTKKLEQGAEKKTEKEESDRKEKKDEKKVIIEELIITDPALNVSITAAGGNYIPIKLGTVELKDIGKEDGGVTAADAVRIIFSVITSNIENAVLGAGNLLGSGVDAVEKGVKAVGSGAMDAGGAVGGAVMDAGEAVGGAVMDAGGTVMDGASSIIKGVGGLFDGDGSGAASNKVEETKPAEERPAQ